MDPNANSTVGRRRSGRLRHQQSSSEQRHERADLLDGPSSSSADVTDVPVDPVADQSDAIKKPRRSSTKGRRQSSSSSSPPPPPKQQKQEESSSLQETTKVAETTTRPSLRRSSRLLRGGSNDSNNKNVSTTSSHVNDDKQGLVVAIAVDVPNKKKRRPSSGPSTAIKMTSAGPASSAADRGTGPKSNKRRKTSSLPSSSSSSQQPSSNNRQPLGVTTRFSASKNIEGEESKTPVTKTVITPSPIAAPTAGRTAFNFDTPHSTDSDHQRSSGQSTLDDSTVPNRLPPGVIDLYPPSVDDTTKGDNAHIGVSSLWPSSSLNGEVDVCNSDILTAGFVLSYGKDYWGGLKEREKPSMRLPAYLDRFLSSSSSSSSSSTSDIGGNNGRSDSSSPEWRTPEDRRGLWMNRADTAVGAIQNRLSTAVVQPTESSRFLYCQPYLTPKMRTILVDWMIELSEHFNFGPSTLHHAITMVDRVLAQGPFGDKYPHNVLGFPKHGQRRRQQQQQPKRTSHHDEDDDADNIDSRDDVNDQSDDDDYDFDDLDHLHDDEDDEEDDDDDDEDDEDDDDNRSNHIRSFVISRDRFQLLGATCTWMACKLHEVNPPKVSEIAYVSDHLYSAEQIKRMELRVCNALEFKILLHPTPHQYLFEYLRASSSHHHRSGDGSSNGPSATLLGLSGRPPLLPPSQSALQDMTNYLLELGRLPYSQTLVQPSLLAAAAVYLARIALGIRSEDRSVDTGGIWTPTLVHYTGYEKEGLKDTVLAIHSYHVAAETSTLKAAYVKYKTKKFKRVAWKPVPRKEELGF